MYDNRTLFTARKTMEKHFFLGKHSWRARRNMTYKFLDFSLPKLATNKFVRKARRVRNGCRLWFPDYCMIFGSGVNEELRSAVLFSHRIRNSLYMNWGRAKVLIKVANEIKSGVFIGCWWWKTFSHFMVVTKVNFFPHSTFQKMEWANLFRFVLQVPGFPHKSQ